MCIGHFAVALAAKRSAPRASLGILVAAQLIDLVLPVFLLLVWKRVRIAPGDTAFTPLDFEHYPWTLVAFLVVIHLANAFGPPPPSVAAVARAGLAAWLIPFWAAWADRHRIVLPAQTPASLASLER